MTTPSLDDLIGRLERATGSDRITDAMLTRDVAGLCLHGSWHSEGPDGDRGRVCDDCGADSWGNLGRHGQRLNDPIPAYTASVDIVLALVERKLPGWKWSAGAAGIKTGEKTPEGYPVYGEGYKAALTERSVLRPMPVVATAATAPLAICLALLRALKAQTSEQNT